MDRLTLETDRILIGGDYNGRIADKNYVAREVADDLCILEQRISLDLISTPRGDTLVEFMESYGLLTLNGRVCGDIPGQITFISSVGKSTVDLTWCTLELCRQTLGFSVSDSILLSDHLPVSTRLSMNWHDSNRISRDNNETDQPPITRFTWSEDKKEEFKQKLNDKSYHSILAELYMEMKNNIHETARETSMVRTIKPNKAFNYNPTKRPWYNRECQRLKKAYRRNFRLWKRNRLEEDLRVFLELKKRYFKLCSQLKKEHERKITEKLSNLRNAGEFWKTISMFKPKKKSMSEQIPITQWYEYLVSVFPITTQNPQALWFADARRDPMDSHFCTGELNKAISHLKTSKSPGPDNILNEYIKAFGDDGRVIILNYLNYLFDGGVVPTSMSESNIIMLHKKGDIQVHNFRTIALLSNVFKLLTHMISARILNWSEENKQLIEAQAGFRPRRGCVDNVFTLASIINIQLINHQKLYAGFVDFKSAFSEVDHSLLWQKAYQFGISSKIITLLRNLYDKAETRIKSGHELTPPCKINKGLMQGDSVSPVLFLIFLNDIEDYFKNKGFNGVQVNHREDILLLLYADDLIIFANNKMDMQRKLNTLQEYCTDNKMMVNVSKSKVVIFRRGGRVARSDTLLYDGECMEVRNEYNYLGVLFSSHAVFRKAADQAISKGRVAVGNVKKTMCNSKMVSFDSRLKLFNSIVKATLLYGCEIWGSRYEDAIEIVQSQFFKSIYCLPRNTPGYMVRLEMGVVKLSYYVLKQSLLWLYKLLSMPTDRYPRMCFDQLEALDQRSRNILKYNWVTLLKTKFVDLGYGDLWENLTAESLKLNIDVILESYRSELINDDWERLQNSTFCDLYKGLKSYPEDHHQFTSEYLFDRKSPLAKHRVLAQLRLSGERIVILANNMFYQWNVEEVCGICNMLEAESLHHFLVRCPQYVATRAHFLREILSKYDDNIALMLNTKDRTERSNIYYYVCGALKLRAFLRNEW
ncbi:hypothetical protein WDU94_000009 [Cyamophila willieti]